MTHQKTDVRSRRTRGLIQAAFIELVEHKGLDQVSVLDITKQAGINRATFYEYFRNKYDLVEEIFMDAINRLTAEIAPPREMLNVNDIAKSLADKVALRAWEKFFEHFAANARMYAAMISGKGGAWFQSRMRRQLVRFAKARFLVEPRGKKLPNAPGDVIPWVFASSLVGVLQSWLDERKSYSASQVLTGFFRIVHLDFVSAVMDQ